MCKDRCDLCTFVLHYHVTEEPSDVTQLYPIAGLDPTSNFGPKHKIIAKTFGSFDNSSYLCSVRMSSEGANDLLSKQNSSWTFLTTIRGHSP